MPYRYEPEGKIYEQDTHLLNEAGMNILRNGIMGIMRSLSPALPKAGLVFYQFIQIYFIRLYMNCFLEVNIFVF